MAGEFWCIYLRGWSASCPLSRALHFVLVLVVFLGFRREPRHGRPNENEGKLGRTLMATHAVPVALVPSLLLPFKSFFAFEFPLSFLPLLLPSFVSFFSSFLCSLSSFLPSPLPPPPPLPPHHPKNSQQKQKLLTISDSLHQSQKLHARSRSFAFVPTLGN